MILRPTPEEVDMVMYHGRCPDGSCARWIAERNLKDMAEYQPVYHYCEFPDVTGRNVLLADFAPQRHILEKVIEQARSVIVLDHHASAKDTVADIDCVVLDDSGHESGASMTWRFFHGNDRFPFIVDNVRMGDTFSWPGAEVRQESSEFMTWFNEQGYSVDLYEKFLTGRSRKKYIDIGRTLMAHDDESFRRACGNARRVTVQGRPGLIANVSHFRGSAATYMCEQMGVDVGVAYTYDDLRNETVFSLRASKTSGINLVLTVAQVPGGGGHRAAAGFAIPGPYDPKVVDAVLGRVFP